MGRQTVESINDIDYTENKKTPEPVKEKLHSGKILILYILTTLLGSWPLAQNFIKPFILPGINHDAYQNLWNLWWVKTALVDRQTNPFHTDLLFYPRGASLLYQTLNFTHDLLALPLVVLWGPGIAYNFLVIFCLVASGFSAYLLANRILYWLNEEGRINTKVQIRLVASFLAGLAFTFSPLHTSYMSGNLDLLGTEALPVYALCLLEALRAQKSFKNLCWGAGAGLAYVYTAMTAWYYALHLTVFTLIVIVWYLIIVLRDHKQIRQRLFWQRHLMALIGFTFITLPLLLPVLIPMIHEAQFYTYVYPSLDHTYWNSIDLTDFLIPGRFHFLWGEWATQEQTTMHNPTWPVLYLGLITGSLALLGAISGWRERFTNLWTLCFLAFALLACGPHLFILGKDTGIPLPYQLLQYIPFFNIGRRPDFFMMMGVLGLSVLTARGAVALPGLLPQRFRQLRTTKNSLVILSILSIAIFIEFIPAPFPVQQNVPSPFFSTIMHDQQTYSILELPANRDGHALVNQIVDGKPLVSGYISRPYPDPLVVYAPVIYNLYQYLPIVNHDDVIDPQNVAPMDSLRPLQMANIRYIVYRKNDMDKDTFTLTSSRAKLLCGNAIYTDDSVTVFAVPSPVNQADWQPLIYFGEGWYPVKKGRDRNLERNFNISKPGESIEGQIFVLRPPGENYDYILRLRVQDYSGEAPARIFIYQEDQKLPVIITSPHNKDINTIDIPLHLTSQLTFFRFALDSSDQKQSWLSLRGISVNKS